jgi:dTDP-4-amino-4,6-dideoxygalactose transaminase
MTNSVHVPFNEAFISGNEFAYMADAVARKHISGDGYYSKKCREYLESEFAAKAALLTTSCTHALEIAALALDISPGDEIIAPAYTFPTSVGSFVLRGARPIFADVRPDTLNIDERLVEGLITSRTRAIVVVHYAGVGCEMDVIMRIASKYGIAVVEDNAHGLFGAYRGRKLGTFGTFSTLSFHETKNVTCGEGGAIVINDASYMERVEIIREKGTDRSRFMRGLVEKYTWVDNGSSYLPSDLLAAFLFAQLESAPIIQAKRHRVWSTYNDQLEEWALETGIDRPFVPEYCAQPAFMYHLLLPTPQERDRFIDHMRSRNVHCVFHYLPLHNSKMAHDHGFASEACHVTDSVSSRLIRLPFYTGLEESAQARVIAAAREFRPLTTSGPGRRIDDAGR